MGKRGGRHPVPVETIHIPKDHADLADRRVFDIVRRCCHDANIIESIARSCYLQGLIDGAYTAALTPALLTELKELTHVEEG